MRTTHQRSVSARATLDTQVKEQALQQSIVKLAHLTGWEWIFHASDSRFSNAGLPDLILASRNFRPARLIFAELKTEAGTLSKGKWYGKGSKAHYELGQDEVLTVLREIRGIEVYLWRPHDWSSGEIERILKGT